MSLGPLYVFLGEVSVQVFCPFFNWVVCLPGVESCEFFIYLQNRPLSELSLANRFSHSAGSLCNLVLFSLGMQKLFILMRSHLFILSFMSLALGFVSVRMLLHGMTEIFLPMFYSRIFMMLWLIFKSFINLEFIFVYGIGWWLSFIFFFTYRSRSPKAICWRGRFCSILCFFPFTNINWP